VIAIDIGGEFLNTEMASTGVEVHMRLNRIMTSMLMQLDPSYEEYRKPDDKVLVRLDVGRLEVDSNDRDLNLMCRRPQYYLIYWPSTGAIVSCSWQITMQLCRAAAGVYDLQRLGPEPQYDECNGVDHPSPGPDNGDEAAIGSNVAPQWI
jgi:hypothetical protein